MPRGRPRKYAGPLRKGEKSASVRGLTKTEQRQTAQIAKRVVRSSQEVKQRAWQINGSQTLAHNVQEILFGTSTNGGLMELKQQGATASDHLTTRPHPVEATPKNNPSFIREGDKVKVSSVHLDLCVSPPIDRQGTKLRVLMFWFPVGHSTTWTDLVASEKMSSTGFNQLLIPLNRNSVCKVFMDRVYTIGQAGAGGSTNNPTTTMIKLRKTFKGGKWIKYKADKDDQQPDRYDIGMAMVAYNNVAAAQSDNVLFYEYAGNMYFRDS